MTDILIQELEQLATSLVGMTNALDVPELGAGIALAEALVSSFQSELSGRGVDLHDAKAAIDASTKAALLAKFGPKP